MGARPPAPRRVQALVAALRAAHPEAEPLEAHPDEVAEWVAAAGADPDDHALVAAALTEWEAELP